MKKIKGTLVFELAVGQCAAIVEENNPNQVLRTSKVVTIVLGGIHQAKTLSF